jgi:ArsR family transcriptional regulator
MLRDVNGSTHFELTVARFRALGDPTRLRVIQELAAGTRCVCELRDRVDVPGPLLSHHLGVLRDAGLVTASRRGRWVDYTLDADALNATFAAVAPDLAGAAR